MPATLSGMLPPNRTQPVRSLRIAGRFQFAGGERLGVIVTDERSRETGYYLTSSPDDMGNRVTWARERDTTAYTVTVQMDGTCGHCTCPGFRWGWTCRHCKGTAVLIGRGLIPASK